MDRYGKVQSRGGRGGLSHQRPVRASPQPTTSTIPPKATNTSPYPPVGLPGGEDPGDQESQSNPGAKRMLQLNAQLQLDRQAAQLRAIGEFATLFDSSPNPMLINSGLIRLAELFHELGNGARQVICQTFKLSRFHLKQLLNKDQVVNKIAEVSGSNDYLARSLCLRTLAIMSEQISEQIEMHYLVFRGLDASEELEVAAALEFAAVMVGCSQAFATTLLPKLHSMLTRKPHPRIEKRIVTTLETFCSHVDLAHRARQLCLDHLKRTAERVELTLGLLVTSTALAIADVSASQDQIKLLFEHLGNRPVATCALECLVRMAKAGQYLSSDRLQELVQLGPATTLRVLMVMKFSRLQLDFETLPQLPPLPETNQVLVWIQQGEDLAFPYISCEGSLKLIFSQFKADSIFSRTLLAAQILLNNATSTLASRWVLKLTALRLWVEVARQTCPNRLGALLSTLAIVTSRYMTLEPTSQFDQHLILATLKLQLGSERNPLTEVIGRWVLMYCSTYLRPTSHVDFSLDEFAQDPTVLSWAVCLKLHVLNQSFVEDLPSQAQVKSSPYYGAALAEMAICAHRTSHHQLAAKILPELRTRVSSDSQSSFLLGLQAWSEGEAGLTSHLRETFPDSTWVATFSNLTRNFYRAATCFQAWAASQANSSPLPAWWLQIRAESLVAIRTLLSILVILPDTPTPFHLTQLRNLLSCLAKLRTKAAYLGIRFYDLDTTTRTALRDRRLQLAILSYSISHLFQVNLTDRYPELLSVQATASLPSIQTNPTCQLALDTIRQPTPDLKSLWQILRRILATPAPSPPAIFNPHESITIKLAMDPTPHPNKPIPILRDTVLRFSGSVLQHTHHPHPPTSLRLILTPSLEPILDLPYNLDVQSQSPHETTDSWVTEFTLATTTTHTNFQITASLPSSFYTPHPSPKYLIIGCALFNPLRNEFAHVGPKFSVPIMLD